MSCGPLRPLTTRTRCAPRPLGVLLLGVLLLAPTARSALAQGAAPGATQRAAAERAATQRAATNAAAAAATGAIVANAANSDVPKALRTPRATMRTFLEAFAKVSTGEAGAMAEAVGCLELSHLTSAVRDERGEELAVSLKEIIDRIKLVVFEEIPDRRQGDPWLFYRGDAADGGAGGQAVIRIARSEDGAWRFDQQTVKSIPALLRALEDRERIEGVVQAPESLSPGLWMRGQMPSDLRRVGFLIEHWQWLGILALLLLGVVVDRVVGFILGNVLTGWLKQRSMQVSDELTDKSLRPFGVLAMAMAWRFGLPWLALPPGGYEVLTVASRFVAAFAGVWGMYRLVDVVVAVLNTRAAASESKFDDILVPLVGRGLKLVIAGFGLVFIADSLDVSVSSLLAGLGLAGMAVALAAQDTVKNIFGSLTVLLDRPFSVGDWITVAGVEGTVEELGFRSTRIRTFYNSLITLPNSNLISAHVDNYGERKFRRFTTRLGVAYETPPERIEAFCEGIRELIRRHPYTRKDSFHVYMNAFGDSALEILLYMFFDAPDWGTELRERHRLCLDIIRLAQRLGVDFAYPTQTLYFKDVTRAEAAPPLPFPTVDNVSTAAQHGAAEAAKIVAGTLPDGMRPEPVIPWDPNKDLTGFEAAMRGGGEG